MNLFIDHLLKVETDKADAFWQAKLAGFSGPLFPTTHLVDHRSTTIQTIKRSMTVTPLRALGITMATTIKLAWALTLSQYSGSNDVVFGLTLSGRNVNVPGIEEIMGPTMTTVPFRIHLQRTMRVHDLLRAVQEDGVATLPFEHLGLQRISSLGPEAALACKFQSLLIIQPPKGHFASTIFNSVIENHSTETVDNYILTMEAHLEEGECVHFEASYDPYFIEDSLMCGILSQLAHNLGQLMESTADITIKELLPVNYSDFGTIKTWNDRVPPAIACCVHDVIRRHCMAQPNSTAVTSWDGTMTYEQLEEHSAIMAAHLAGMGIRPGTFVMIHLGRCLWTVVAMVAVMKAGGAFVLLDSRQPTARLRQLCEETQGLLVITSRQFLSDHLGPRVVNIDSYKKWPSSQQPSAEAPVGPHHPAYVVFTSGSTGRPKGVVIQHQAILTSAVMNGGRQHIHSGTRFLQCSSLTFDACIAEILYSLVHGACVCIPTEADCQNNIEKSINDYAVTCATLTPSVARTMDPSKLTTLRTLLLGGEAMTSMDVRMWAGRLQLANGYGPAECSVDAIVQPNVTPDSEPTNIGWGVAVASWVVESEETGILRPIGAVGELLLEGPTLAQGYLHDPEKTTASFIEYPDWLRRLRHGKPGRLYRTGDLVRYSPKGDGSLLYMGRRDNQVKLRGQRIELGEVEQHLREVLPDAREVFAEVVKPSDATAQPTLAAYVLAGDVALFATDEKSLWVSASESFRAQIQCAEAILQSRIPRYMIPAVFLPLARIPLTNSGKVNRRLLREEASKLSRKELGSYTSTTSTKVSSPSTREESALQSAISTVLQLPLAEIGMQDHFVRLGGDSIAAMKLVGLLRKSGFSLAVAEIFNCPRISDLARLVRHEADDSLSPFESIPPLSLLDHTSRAAVINAAANQCHVDRDNIEDIYPCTPMQEGLLALSMRDRDAYIGKLVFNIPKGTNIDLLQSAWQAVFEANPILRTRVVQAPGGSTGLYQAVLRQPLQWSENLSPLQITLGEPLYKICIRLHNDELRLHLWLHHALYDGVSLSGLLRQAEAAYNGRPLDLRPFSPFVAYASSFNSAASRQFWGSELSDIDAAAMFPAPMSNQPDVANRESISHTASLLHTSNSQFTLPAMIQLACAVVFGHWIASDDVIYGLTLAGRNASVKGIDKISGPTITTVPFRCKLPLESKIEGCLQDMQDRLVRMIPHEQMGLQNIRSISPETKIACGFQCHLVIQLYDEDASAQDSLFREPPSEDDVYSNFASYPLVLVCRVCPDRQTVRFASNFHTSSLSRNEAIAVLNQLDHVLQQIVRNQNQTLTLADLELISPPDWLRLAELNATVPPNVNQLIHDLVFENSEIQPGKTAIDSWDGTLSYHELLTTSAQFARHLNSMGVGAHPVTAICLEKSRWTIVAVLAVLQTGSAYTMIDPSHPVTRMQAMINQTAAAFTVVSPLTKGLLENISPSVVVLSPFVPDPSQSSTLQSTQATRPNDPAIIQFTSGSTGKPKAIVWEHKNISTAMRDAQRTFNLDRSARLLHFASYAFDASMLEIFGCLAAGGCLCIPSELDRMSNLEAFIREHEVNWATLTPSASSLLKPSEVPSLKTLVLGGEPLTASVVDRWADNLCLINGYGPAECTIFVATGRVPTTGWIQGTIGPACNCVCWITSISNPTQLAAWGAVGELLVEGPNLARGYMGSPEKTASSFISSPPWLTKFRGHDKSRLYRTGDLVQYTENGEIRYIGRRDRQVKLNGQRIELAEIESHLAPCFPDGTTVVVEKVTSQLPPARPHLCAFVCLRAKEKQTLGNAEAIVFADPDEEFLRLSRAAAARLSTSLPQYMVPRTFIPVNQFPLTATEKINRRLLCELASVVDSNELDDLTIRSEESRAPSTKTEKKLADLWAELLGIAVDRIGVGDSFFHIGGDSILAMKLAAEMRRHGLILSVPHIFSHPILSAMASVVETRNPSSETCAATAPFALLEAEVKDLVVRAAAQQCSVASEQIEDIYPCTPLQEGLTSLSMSTAGAFLGSFSYSLPVDIDLSRFRKAWQAVAGSNPILRTRIVQDGNGTLFQVVIREDLSWAVIDNINEYSFSLSQREMQLGQPLLYLAHGHQRPGCRTELLLVIHHVIYDGWSLHLILDQVRQAYDGNSLPLRPFNGFIEHLVHSGNKLPQDKYWIDQLAGVTGTTFPSLPSSNYRPVAHSTISETISLQSPTGTTKATLLQLAWSLALSRYSDTSDVVFGLALSGRQASVSGIDSITGPTLTTVPLRVRLQNEQTVISKMHQLQEQLAAMVPYEQLGLQNIRRLGADAAAVCQFQNLLLIQPTSAPSRDGFLSPIDGRGRAEAFSAYALEVTCETSAYETNITFDFDPRVIKKQQAQRILSCYTHLLWQMQQDPSQKISNLDFVDPSARKEIMEWNAVLPQEVYQFVHNDIQQQCLESPDAPAVCAWDGDFTYRELDHVSSSFALHLQNLGIGPEIFIPICAEKLRWMAVAILGIIKAGGAVILLDPKVPFERLRTICQDVNAHTVVSSCNCADLASQLATTVVIAGRDGLPESQKNGQIVLPAQFTPRSALYAIFTSGSTGKPKGIVIGHAAFYTSGCHQQRPLYLDSSARTLQFASHMFDVAIADYLWTFLTGGCVCIPSEDGLKNSLPGVVNELRVNRIDMTPSLARVYRPEDMPTIKTILLGGEPMSQVDVQMWADRVRLVNGYGPSECSVCCILADVSAHSDPSNIGKTYGAVAWIVDQSDHSRLVPPGAPGELVLEGYTLARGYLGEPEKTAAAFINSPPWLRELRPESRLYKTGDLVQYEVDGTIRYLGRKDTQVKIRGQRVELGEIEHQIRRASPSAVRDVVVELIATPGHQQTGRVLVAFVCDHLTPIYEDNKKVNGETRMSIFGLASPEQRAESQDISRALKKCLPSYMIPIAFFPLTYMPVLPSGKADRRFLRDQAAVLPRQSLGTYFTRHVAQRSPTTSSEQILQGVVAEVLRLEASEVGMDDDFFQLGGDSIIAIRLVSRARESGFSFRVTDVFRSPKLSDLALLRAGDGAVERTPDIVLSSAQYLGFAGKDDMIETVLSSRRCSVTKGNVCDILPVTQAAERMLFQSPEYWGVNLQGPIDHDRLQWACTELVHRHDILRTVFLPLQDRFVQVVLDHIDTRIQRQGFITNLDGFLDQHRREDHISIPTIDTPVTRFTFAQGPQEMQILVVRLSHAQFDGYSLHTLWHDLKCLYEGTS